MIFHEASIALKIAVGIAGLLPIIIVYSVIALSRIRSLTFGAAVSITIAYIVSFIAISIVFSNISAWQKGYRSLSQMLKMSSEITALAFPGLILTVFSCLIVIVVWRADFVRYVFACFSALIQALYFINVILFLLGIEVIYF